MISFGNAASSHSGLIPLKTAYKKRGELLRAISSKKNFINLHSLPWRLRLQIASLWTPHSPRQFSFLSCFRGESMDVFWNYTMHMGDSKLCCFHFPTPVSTLQT